MRNSIPPAWDLSPPAASNGHEKRELGSDANDRKHSHKCETGLQELIERETEDIKPHIDSKDRV